MNQHSVPLKITDTSTYAINRMKAFPVFQVHSVYRKTINIHAEGNLLAIQAKESPLSPVSLITNLTQAQIEQLPVKEGQAVYITDSHLVFCNISEKPEPLFAFNYSSASVSDLVLPVLFPGELPAFEKKLKKLIFHIICNAGTNGMDLVYSGSPLLENNLIMTAAKKRIETTTALLKANSWKEAADELIRLIGLGIGLTPSGDDFTTGVLAGLILFEHRDCAFAKYYSENVLAHRYDTNDVSRTFITSAMEGHFSTAINSLACVKKEDLGENILQTGDRLLHKFLAIGHSSGIDALCGIYFVLCNLYNLS